MKNFTFSTFLKCKSVSFLALVLICSISFAQNPYTIQFQDETIDMPENIDTFQWDQMPENAEIANGYIGWVQFYQTPTQVVQDRFASNNLELLNYIPHQTYLFYFPANTSVQFLRQNGVRSIVPVEGRFKLSQNLKNGVIGNWARVGSNILVTLQHHDLVDTQYVINDLATKQISVHEEYRDSNNIDLLIPDNCLDALSELPYVKWVEVIVAPSIPDDTRGRSIHRANNIDTETTGGRKYDGTGVAVLCRDDGPVGIHVDFEGRAYGLVGNGGGTHGDGVSGIMAGAGNFYPTRKGMAAGSDLHAVNYVASFLDGATTSLINAGTVQITNSSYSNGCNAGYTSITQTVDTQMHTLPNLLHVFSAGNSNGLNCGYGAGNQWGNITGGHKQGKNVIATANTNYLGVLENSSSRGPAHDGRIKPDIAAHGQGQLSTSNNHTYQTFGGTSAAAPGIAGVSAQLYQAYMDENSGNLPPGALIKAILMNTANDYGNVGPDFKFGWGMVNGLRAAMTIEDGRHLSDDVSQGNTNTHTINVPSGAVQVRFMVYWADSPASPGADPALVNDLDLEVTDPSAGTHLPWVLDSTPNATALDTPATTGVDHLNNMEQVLINNPAAGNYDIDVTGFNVPMGPQEYYVVWEIITENLVLTYPTEVETFIPNETQTIHWDATNIVSNILVEYSTDNGASWTTIATVAPTQKNVNWSVEDTQTAEGLIRITSGAFTDQSDENFSISRFPGGLTIDSVCPTEATFSWNAVAGAESYDLYILGPMYMEIAGNTTNTTITVPIPDPTQNDIWYGVAARNDTEGWVSRRTNSGRHTSGLNCSLGVEDAVLASNVSLYPNPAADQVFVSLNDTSFNNFEITVINSLGQTMQTISAKGNEAAINISNYTTGLYFVTIEVDGSTTTKKLVVK